MYVQSVYIYICKIYLYLEVSKGDELNQGQHVEETLQHLYNGANKRPARTRDVATTVLSNRDVATPVKEASTRLQKRRYSACKRGFKHPTRIQIP